MKEKRILEEKKRIGTWGILNPSRLELILKYAGKKILDAGCSSGVYVRYLLSRGYDTFGFDLLSSEGWEGELKERCKTGDLHNIPYEDEEFDTVTAFEVLEHVEDVDKALEELKRIVKQNIILSVPDSELHPVMKESGLTFFHWVDRTHIQFFTEESLRKKLEEHDLSLQFLGKINPVYPEFLFFESFRFPFGLVKFLAKVVRKIPSRKKYFMTLIAVVTKK